MEETMVKASKLKKLNIPLEEQAKSIVLLAFRNGPIENIHAGEDIKIPKAASRITQDEMKELMVLAVNRVYRLLWLKEHEPCLYNILITWSIQDTRWDDPDMSTDLLNKIDSEYSMNHNNMNLISNLFKYLVGEKIDRE